MSSKYIYGIDFGTSNSSLAILDTQKNEVVQLFTEPSLLFFPEPAFPNAPLTHKVGKAAMDGYVANRMRGRFMKSIKKVLPNRSFVDTEIGRKRFKAEDLIALVLRHLKEKADDFLGENIRHAVIGRPVLFSENSEKDALAESRLAQAARLAGFEQFYFQFEPIGAAYTYERSMQKPELVLVGDFGGGTSDFSIMRLRPDAIHNPDRSADMLAKGGIYIGGDSFDSDIMWHRGTPYFGRGVKEQFEPGKWLDLPSSYFTNICSWEKMNFLDNVKMRNKVNKSYVFSGRDYRVKNLQTLIDANLGYVLFQHIEQCKIDLTNHDAADFTFDMHDIKINENISIGDFADNIIDKNVAKIADYLQTFLTQQNIAVSDIDTVFLTGGSSYVRPLKDIFDNLFGKQKIRSGDNFNSVAIGLAYSYPILACAAEAQTV